jgi:tetratricopeptide (TPR) repeat protein
VSYGKATPYFPVLDLLKRYSHIDDHDDTRTIRAKLTGQVLTLDMGLQDVIPALLALLDALPDDSSFRQLEPAQRRQRTLTALKRVLLRESRVQPLLLVFEDLHWIDTETQALLDSLAESLPTAQLLLLVNYRPEYQHDWGSKTYYTQLRLDPLPPMSADEFLHALLGDDVSLASLKQFLIERTAGNPFFLEESVRTLVESGVLQGERGAYRLGQAPQTVLVPATVQAVLAARIDRLPPEEKGLLQTAAVIGPEVPLPLLQAIAELPEDAVQGALAHLQAAEFLYETRLFPEPEYTFKHALTHEVAYSGLLQERRRMLHARIVETLEKRAGDRVVEEVERLAHHALRGEVWDKALAYCRQAGEKVMARSAHREAVGYFEQALSALPHLPKQRTTQEQAIDLRLALRTALRPLGEFERIVTCLCEAEMIAAALDDTRRLGQIGVFLSNHFYFIGAYDDAIAASQRSRALATANNDVVQQALANLRLGSIYLVQGDYRRAVDCLSQTMAALDGAQRYELFSQVLVPAVHARANLLSCYAELGTFPEGMALGAEALQIAETVALPASLMIMYYQVGRLALCKGDLHTAFSWLEHAVRLCREADLPAYFPRLAPALGVAYALTGRVADAVPLLTQAMQQAMAAEMVVNQALCCLSLGEAQLLAGHLAEAQALAEQALTLARTHKERGNEAYALRLLGDIAARHEPPEHGQAEAHYQQALTLADELGMRPLQAHCHCGLGMLYAKLVRREQACTALSAAIEMYRSMEMTFWLLQTEATLTQVEGR